MGYVNTENLKYYDSKIKEYINQKIQDSLKNIQKNLIQESK